MYRILLAKAGLPKDTYAWYKKTTTITDEDTGNVTTTTAIFETDDIDILKEEYITLLQSYTTAAVIPVDNLLTELSVTITDETN